MTVHAKHSPSGLHAKQLCPLFQNDENRDTSAADAGTRKHTAVELKKPEMMVDQEDRDAVMQCILHEQKLKAQYPNAQVINEMPLRSSLNYGTGDLVLIDLEQRVAIIRDWKFGQVPVPAPEYNLQLMSYTYNLFSMVPEIDRINVGIVQPAIKDCEQDTWVPREAMPGIKIRIDRIIEEAEDPNAQPRPNDNCQYCANKATCVHWKDAAAMVVEQNVGLVIPKDWDLIIDDSPEMLSRKRACLSVLEGFITQAKEIFNERAKAIKDTGGEIPGYDIRSKRGNLKVIDVYQAFIIAYNDPNIDTKTFIEKCLTVKAKGLIEMVADAHNLDTQVVEQEFTELNLVERGAGSTYMQKKRGSDPAKILSGEK